MRMMISNENDDVDEAAFDDNEIKEVLIMMTMMLMKIMMKMMISNENDDDDNAAFDDNEIKEVHTGRRDPA